MRWARVERTEDWHVVESQSVVERLVRSSCGELFPADAVSNQDPRQVEAFSNGFVFLCGECLRAQGRVAA